jgi:hypothetical protein
MPSSHYKRLYILEMLVIAAVMVGCSDNDTVVNNNQIVGSGRLVTQVRNVGAFNGIQVTNFAKVVITQDTVEQVRIVSDDNIIDHVGTVVNGSNLVVGLDNGSYSNITVNVYASMKTIKRLESMGTADFSVASPVQSDSIHCRITGAGSVTLSGTATFEQVEIIGAGTIHNFGLVASNCTTLISGSGIIEVNVTSRLDAIIAGTGSIVYDGSPLTVQQSVSGVGSVKPR